MEGSVRQRLLYLRAAEQGITAKMAWSREEQMTDHDHPCHTEMHDGNSSISRQIDPEPACVALLVVMAEAGNSHDLHLSSSFTTLHRTSRQLRCLLLTQCTGSGTTPRGTSQALHPAHKVVVINPVCENERIFPRIHA